MWKCKKCGEENEDTFDSCWSCSTDHDGISSTDTKTLKSLKEDVSTSDYSKSEYTTTYGTARATAQFVSFIGWAVFIISLLILAGSLIKSLGPDQGFALIGIFPSFAGAVSGLLLVMAGQMTRAIVDTADNTGNMLAITKKRKRS
ncbi:MAG: hypothetical protein ABFD76_01125 [Smithella sp.]